MSSSNDRHVHLQRILLVDCCSLKPSIPWRSSAVEPSNPPPKSYASPLAWFVAAGLAGTLVQEDPHISSKGSAAIVETEGRNDALCLAFQQGIDSSRTAFSQTTPQSVTSSSSASSLVFTEFPFPLMVRHKYFSGSLPMGVLALSPFLSLQSASAAFRAALTSVFLAQDGTPTVSSPLELAVVFLCEEETVDWVFQNILSFFIPQGSFSGRASWKEQSNAGVPLSSPDRFPCISLVVRNANQHAAHRQRCAELGLAYIPFDLTPTDASCEFSSVLTLTQDQMDLILYGPLASLKRFTSGPCQQKVAETQNDSRKRNSCHNYPVCYSGLPLLYAHLTQMPWSRPTQILYPHSSEALPSTVFVVAGEWQPQNTALVTQQLHQLFTFPTPRKGEGLKDKKDGHRRFKYTTLCVFPPQPRQHNEDAHQMRTVMQPAEVWLWNSYLPRPRRAASLVEWLSVKKVSESRSPWATHEQEEVEAVFTVLYTCFDYLPLLLAALQQRRDEQGIPPVDGLALWFTTDSFLEGNPKPSGRHADEVMGSTLALMSSFGIPQTSCVTLVAGGEKSADSDAVALFRQTWEKKGVEVMVELALPSSSCSPGASLHQREEEEDDEAEDPRSPEGFQRFHEWLHCWWSTAASDAQRTKRAAEAKNLSTSSLAETPGQKALGQAVDFHAGSELSRNQVLLFLSGASEEEERALGDTIEKRVAAAFGAVQHHRARGESDLRMSFTIRNAYFTALVSLKVVQSHTSASVHFSTFDSEQKGDEYQGVFMAMRKADLLEICNSATPDRPIAPLQHVLVKAYQLLTQSTCEETDGEDGVMPFCNDDHTHRGGTGLEATASPLVALFLYDTARTEAVEDEVAALLDGFYLSHCVSASTTPGGSSQYSSVLGQETEKDATRSFTAIPFMEVLYKEEGGPVHPALSGAQEKSLVEGFTEGMDRVVEIFAQQLWSLRTDMPDTMTSDNCPISLTRTDDGTSHKNSCEADAWKPVVVVQDAACSTSTSTTKERNSTCEPPAYFLMDPVSLRTCCVKALQRSNRPVIQTASSALHCDPDALVGQDSIKEKEECGFEVDAEKKMPSLFRVEEEDQKELADWMNRMKQYGDRLPAGTRRRQAEVLALALEPLMDV